MNILVCDDMQDETEKLVKLIDASAYDIHTVAFHDSEAALSYVNAGAIVDVCFLDILMPKMNGILLADKLRQGGFAGEIVFLTHSNDYAMESYQVDAFSYLLKPPTAQSVYKVMRKLEIARHNNDTGSIMIKTKDMVCAVLFLDISYIEIIQHIVHFHLVSGDVLKANSTLSEVAGKLLHDRRFAQCHRSYIINMAAVSAIQGREIVMQSGVKIPISKSHAGVKKRYLQWVFGGENYE